MSEEAAAAEPVKVVLRSTYISTIVVVAIAGFIAGLGSYSILFAT